MEHTHLVKPSNKKQLHSIHMCREIEFQPETTLNFPHFHSVHWDTGTLGHWDTGTLGHWETGTGTPGLGHRDWGTGAPGHWDTGTLGHQDTGTLGHWDTRTLERRDTGI